MTKQLTIHLDIDQLITRVDGIKETISCYADAVAADAAITDYIKQLSMLQEYTDGSLELPRDYLRLIEEHEFNAGDIENAKILGSFDYAYKCIQDIYGSFIDMKADLPTLDSLPLYNEMLNEQDGITQSDREFENWRRL